MLWKNTAVKQALNITEYGRNGQVMALILTVFLFWMNITTMQWQNTHAKAVQNLRHLPDVPEGVGEVADHRRRAVFFRFLQADERVTNVRFAANQIFVLQDVEGADFQLACRHQRLDAFRHGRAYVQIILQDNAKKLKKCIEQLIEEQ